MVLLIVVYTAMCVISLAFGTIISLISSVKDLRDDFCHLNEIAEDHKNRLEAFKSMNEIIRLHSVLKQLSNSILKNLTKKMLLNKIKLFLRLFRDAAPIYEPLNQIVAMSSFATMCSTLLMIEMSIEMV